MTDAGTEAVPAAEPAEREAADVETHQAAGMSENFRLQSGLGEVLLCNSTDDVHAAVEAAPAGASAAVAAADCGTGRAGHV